MRTSPIGTPSPDLCLIIQLVALEIYVWASFHQLQSLVDRLHSSSQPPTWRLLKTLAFLATLLVLFILGGSLVANPTTGRVIGGWWMMDVVVSFFFRICLGLGGLGHVRVQ
ncbi:hypothetical protein B0H66DRAFT_570334 [Apodospora peruviana]|uniref:Transmembrane protein n=1 Tax=Apodospora peruviana TaxID=516989 RepID=A0AAE0LZ56_9PEZI|nr:hypothetical protein B0H66DRAFT_570334 [Apodospora peruviana]